MYSSVPLDAIIKSAEKFILDNDRLLYLPFFESAEKFCVSNNVLIGGRVGLDLLTNKPYTKDSFFWELYTGDTFQLAKRFAIELCDVKSPHIPARTVALKTDIRNKEFTIFVNARMLFKLFAMDKYRGIDLVKLMVPTKRQSYFTKKMIGCMTEEMQLIEIYRTLYSPSKTAKWTDDLRAENILFDTVGQESVRKNISGSAECKLDETLKQQIIKKYLSNTSDILVGDYAMSALGLEVNPNRIQFISATPIEQIVAAIESIIKKKIGGNKNLRITFIKYPLNIPSDFQLVKHSIYITGRDQIPVADVFNSTEFELVPWWKMDNVKIGNPWVLLRFQFIDIWTLRMIQNIGSDKTGFIKQKMKSILDRAIPLHVLIMETISSNPEKMFQLENYEGVFINESVAKKKLIKDIGERFNDFYPAKKVE